MTKLIQMRRAESRHVIQARYARMWRTVPGLIYDSRESAQDGLERLLTHRPRLKLRIQRYGGENVSTSRPLAA